MPGLESIRTAGPVDDLLTGYAVSCRNANVDGFVADDIFTRVPVKRDTGTFLIWSSGNVFRNRSSFWAKGAATPEMRIRATSDTFSCKKYGMKTSIDDDDRDNNQSGAALDEEAIQSITKTVLLDREIRCQVAIAALTSDLDIVTPANRQWDESASTSKADIDGGTEAIIKAIGMMPTDMVIGRSVYNSLRNNQAAGNAGKALFDAMVYTMAMTNGNVTAAIIAQFFDVPRVRVAQAVYDAAVETTTVDVANVTGTFIWPDDILLYRREETPTTTSQSFAKTFESVPLHSTPRWREDDVEADWLRVKAKWDEKITSRKAGYLIENVLNAV